MAPRGWEEVYIISKTTLHIVMKNKSVLFVISRCHVSNNHETFQNCVRRHLFYDKKLPLWLATLPSTYSQFSGAMTSSILFEWRVIHDTSLHISQCLRAKTKLLRSFRTLAWELIPPVSPQAVGGDPDLSEQRTIRTKRVVFWWPKAFFFFILFLF